MLPFAPCLVHGIAFQFACFLEVFITTLCFCKSSFKHVSNNRQPLQDVDRLCAHPRWGPTGQGRLLCDIHSALIRVLEGLDEDLMEAPTMAGYGSAADLAPQDAFRPLLGASWPELARRYLQDHGPLTVSQDAVEAVLRLKVLCIPLVMPLTCHARSFSHVAHWSCVFPYLCSALLEYPGRCCLLKSRWFLPGSFMEGLPLTKVPFVLAGGREDLIDTCWLL